MIKLTTKNDQVIFLPADKVTAVCLDSTGHTQVHMEDGTDSFWVVTEPIDEVVKMIENDLGYPVWLDQVVARLTER